MTGIAALVTRALIDSLWQDTLIGVMLALSVARVRPPRPRYAFSCFALLAMLAVPVGTAIARRPHPATAFHSIVVPSAGPRKVDTHAPLTATAPGSTTGHWSPVAGTVTAWAFPIWLAGVFACSIRLFGCGLHVRRLRRHGGPADNCFSAMAQRLAAHMRISRVLRVVISPCDGPASFGWWRPVIVLPAAMMGLPLDQLQVIIAHELAHVRRHDYVLNVCQVIIETLCFYHPAVWWASYRVRVERELCCDDAAVAVCGHAVEYARALTAIARYRLNTPEPAVGATTGPLTRRVARLLGMEPAHCPPPWMPVATGVLLVALVVSAQTWLHAQPIISAADIVDGTVYDPFGRPAENVLLVLVQPPASLPARSDTAGHFEFTDLAPGRYILTTPATDFFTPREIQVSSAGNAAVAVRLAMDETAVNIRVCRDCKPDWFKLPASTTGVAGDAGSHAIVSPAQPAEGWDAFNQRPLAYPPALRTSKTEGTVDIEGTITADGISSDLRVASSDDAALDDAALSLVQSQRWAPARVRSTPVPVPLHATVEFTLNGD